MIMKLSVIVCTQNRAHAIAACLDSIATSFAAAAPLDAEIVVVDNASTDNTSWVVKEWAKNNPVPVQLLFEPKKGLSVARNRGVRSEQGDLLVFTDDDCRMDRDYIVNLLRLDANDLKPVLRGGRVELGDSADLPVTVKTDLQSGRWLKETNSARHENLGNCLLGCNMSMRRSVVQQIGFFDESLGAGAAIRAGEDTDIIFRAYLSGIPIEYSPDVTVYHFHGRKKNSDGYALFRNYSIGGGALYAKYILKDPNLCRQFIWDIKGAVREIMAGKNTYMPEIGFSHCDKVFYCILGFSKYVLRSIGYKL